MDLAIVSWVSEHMRCAFLDWLMPLITMLGDKGAIWLVFCAILIVRKKTRCWGVMCFVALILTTLLGEITIKNLVGRARPFTHFPELLLLISPPASFSFPSGHTGSSFAAATVICFMSKKLGCWALLLAALIGFSRLYLSVHYLTDIITGMLLGVVCAYLARWLCDKYWKTGEIQ
ncbi:phosphatase PAP2 family protein [Oscillospiraceae bacterium PP1C4]